MAGSRQVVHRNWSGHHKQLAAPIIDGIFTSFIVELVVYPVIYEIWRWYFYVRKEAGVPVSA